MEISDVTGPWIQAGGYVGDLQKSEIYGNLRRNRNLDPSTGYVWDLRKSKIYGNLRRNRTLDPTGNYVWDLRKSEIYGVFGSKS